MPLKMKLIAVIAADTATMAGSSCGMSRFSALRMPTTRASWSGPKPRAAVPWASRWRWSCATIVRVGMPPLGKLTCTPVTSPWKTSSSGSGA